MSVKDFHGIVYGTSKGTILKEIMLICYLVKKFFFHSISLINWPTLSTMTIKGSVSWRLSCLFTRSGLWLSKKKSILKEIRLVTKLIIKHYTRNHLSLHMALVFTRSRKKSERHPTNSVFLFVHQEVNYTLLDASRQETEGGGLLSGLEVILSQVFIPAVRKLKHGWGHLDVVQQGQPVRNNFLNSMEAFVSILSGK